jgi:pyridoxamine 5'-phosphate oxidase
MATTNTHTVFSRFDKWFAEAQACASIPYPNAMNLATVNYHKAPSSRIVLLKARDDEGFVFYTNLASRKSEEIKINQGVALCFYWGELSKQIRIEGLAEPTTDAESDAYFATRPRESQLGAWASLQSTAMQHPDDLKTRFAEIAQQYEGKNVPRPPHWGGWRVIPSRIEFWQEALHRLHRRDVYKRVLDGWEHEVLYP